MKKLILATAATMALFAASTAPAQTTAQPATPVPAVGGQASTKTPAGVPNPTQRPDGAVRNTREAVRSEARMDNRSPANTQTPRGEPSTMTNGVPNATPTAGAMTRSEVKPSARQLNPQTGQVGERPDVPTNPKDRTGTPN